MNSTSEKVYSHYDSLTNHKVALVLGTSHLLTTGAPNPFFDNRMENAATLFINGKVKHFIVSGDNRTKYYNEPLEMKRALVRLGIPSSAITLDYAGLRTLDSVVRSKEIFGQDKITIVTQTFHCYRALFISNYYGIDAVAYVANEPSAEVTEKVHWREYLARAKAILDLYVLKTSPRHLGEKEPIQL
ncbi:MAG TPA: ElyC/SanA/YdcF family protein [Cyclobacteriaceae bacterium]|nr:ElyC/SanA/YdcF family protein [Cyclobacteriaceae bacterium]